MDLSKLTNDQLEIAKKVAAEAEKQGLNPGFVLPMVMAESGFNPKAVSKAGALGVMQLMPSTAKTLDIDPNDVDQNIQGGIKFLKKLIENKNIGNDPNKVLMGYNAGPNTKFFQSGKLEDLPDETLNHIVKVSNFYGGTLPAPSFGTSESADRASANQVGIIVPSLPGVGQEGGVPPGVQIGAGGDESTTIPSQEISPLIASAAGAGLGTTSGIAAATARAKIDAATEAYEAIKNRLAGMPESGQTPGGKWAAKTGFGVGEGTVEETSSAYKRATPQGKIAGRMAKLYGIAKPGEDPQLAQRLIDRAKAREAMLAAQAAQKAKTPSAISYGAKLLGMPIKGGLTGATVGFGLADAYNRYFAQKDPTGAAISGAGTAAALASPFVASMGALPALSIAAPLYLAAKDRLEYLKKHPEEIRLETNQYDPMGNPIGGGGLP